ncbi:hypothetical protein [Streptomyces atratus]|uniref:hypothetical protein n=1 Tax=Streptomyces atratus TaxID=1893 RepID=UPI00365A39C3
MSKDRSAHEHLQEAQESYRLASSLLKHKDDRREAQRQENRPRTQQEPSSGYTYEIEKFLPKDLPELRQELVEWTRAKAPWFWYQQHISGTLYYIPPGLRHLTSEHAIARLAEQQAQVLSDAKLYSVTPEMTFLAQKTTMPEFNLTLDMLPGPRGLIIWQQPVGQCEHTDRMRLKVNADGEIEGASIHEWVDGMGKDDIPVLGATWELLPDEDQVMVIWYSSREGLLNNFPEADKPHLREARTFMAPLIFEREQLLPVGRTTGWFTSKEEDRLRLTSSAEHRPGLALSLRELGRERDQDVLPMLDQMTKTLLATWMLMGMRFAKRDVELPDRPARKRLKRAGATESQINSGVQVIKIGGPLRTQKPKEGEASYRWKKRRIVGPFIRNQWYPSQDAHKPKLIEPYIAGPEGAPIGNAEKVYLLSE